MYLVFDFGGTNTRLGTSKDGITIDQSSRFKSIPDGYEKSLDVLEKLAKDLVGDEPIEAMAGGFPGPLHTNHSIIGVVPNLPGWRDKPLADDLSKRFNAPVYLENDTAMVGMGEASQGAGVGHEIVVYLTVSTGVGGCRIVNQAIDANARGFEPGHQIITKNDYPCGCGTNGHLEAVVGGAALEKRFGIPPENIDDPDLWDESARYLAMGLNNILVTWSPHIIVIGGSVMNKIDINVVSQHLNDIVTIYPELPPVVPSTLGEDGGLLGCLAHIKSMHSK